MRTVLLLLLAAQAVLVNAGSYDDIKAQIQALVDGGFGGSSSGSSSESKNWIPDDENYKTQNGDGKKKGLLSRMFDKVKGMLPGGKKKKDESGSITLNDYTQDSVPQENHVHYHKDHHLHREKHEHNEHNRNLNVVDSGQPSIYDYYRFKRDSNQKQRRAQFRYFRRRTPAPALHKNDVAPKKPSDRSRAYIVF